jgi:oxygen-dependent protoporphyrinogen oxidase
VAAIERRMGEHPGLGLAGSAYRGVGIADCIRSGEEAAARIIAQLGAFLG